MPPKPPVGSHDPANAKCERNIQFYRQGVDCTCPQEKSQFHPLVIQPESCPPCVASSIVINDETACIVCKKIMPEEKPQEEKHGRGNCAGEMDGCNGCPQPQATQESWEEVKSEDHWLEVKDPDGWYSAVVKWDGCIHYMTYSNEPMSQDEENQDYLHICDIQGEIDRLYSLLQVARKHYKNHYYYETAFAKEPTAIETAIKEEYQRCLSVLNKDHTKCALPQTCIGYGNARSDLENNPPFIN